MSGPSNKNLALNPKQASKESNAPVKAPTKTQPVETAIQAIRTLSFEDPRDDPKIPLYGMLRFQVYFKDENIAKAYIDAQWRTINGAIEEAGGHYRWMAGRKTADGKVRFCIGFELPSSTNPTPSSIISKIFAKYRRLIVVEFATEPDRELPVPGFALPKNIPIAKDGFLKPQPKVNAKGKGKEIAKAEQLNSASVSTPAQKANNLKPKMVVYYSDSEEDEGREASSEVQEDEKDEDYQDDPVPTSDTAAPVSEDEEVADDDRQKDDSSLPDATDASSDTVMQDADDGDDENDEDWEDYESESEEVDDDDEDDSDYEP